MASLTIDLDDQATDGLADIDAALDQMAATSLAAGKSTDQLTDSQQRQLVVLQKQDVSFKKLADTGLRTFGSLGSEGIKAFTTIETSAERMAISITNNLVNATASTVKFALGSKAAVGIANAVFGDHQKAVKKSSDATDDATESQSRFLGMNFQTAVGLTATGAALDSTTACYNAMSKAADFAGGTAVKAFFGLGSLALGASVAMSALSTVLANTGRGFREFNEDTSKQTGEQATAWKKFINEAKELGVTLDELAESKGITDVNKYLEKTFGVKTLDVYENNLIRVQEAIAGVKSELGSLASEFATSAADMTGLNSAVEFGQKKWEQFDKDLTMRTGNFVANAGLLRDSMRSTVDGASDFWVAITGGDQAAEVRQWEQRIELVKKYGAEHSRLIAENTKSEDAIRRQRDVDYARVTEIQKSAADDIGRYRVMITQLVIEEKKRSEAKEIDAFKTKQQMDDEIYRLKAKAAVEASGNNLSVADAKKSFTAIEALLAKRRALETADHTARLSRLASNQKAEEQSRAASLKADEERYKRRAELEAEEQKRLLKRGGMVRELAELEAKEIRETASSAAKEQHDTQKDAHAERMKTQGATEAQVKTALAAMDKQFNEADHNSKMAQIDDESRAKLKLIQQQRGEQERLAAEAIADAKGLLITKEKQDQLLADRQKELIRLKGDEDKLLADRAKALMQENGRFAREINHLDLADKAQVEQAKFAIERERIGKLKAMQDAENEKPKAKFDGKAFGQMQDPRKVLKALQDQRADEAKTKQSARDEDMGRDAMGGDKSALKKFESNQRQMMAAARRKAADDFNNGNVGDGELQKAQGKVGEQTLGTLQKQGKLNQGQTQALTDALKTLADVQQSLDNQNQTIAQLMANAKGQKEVARQTVKATQNQQGSLN